MSEVLKPRLAKDAINGADVELEEFLGGAEVDEISSFHAGQEPEGKWDLNLVWRRTRLRCMVYTRLGDMEEEDEDMYIERERLEDVNNADRRLSRELGIISPPAAIFLTSILEFIGEHALMVAGEAASNRVEIKQHRGGNMSAPDTSRGSRLAVEDIDVEKLAFNTTLGRLWRSWKKRVRAPSVSSIRPLSREVVRRRALSTSASPSISEIDDPSHLQETVQRPTVNEMLEEEHEPAGSVTEAKVLEHAVRDNMREPPEDEKETNHRPRNRPHSMMVFAHPSKEMSLSFFGQPFVPEQHRRSLSSQNHSQSRKRSSSLPPPGMTPYRSLLSEQSESSNTPGRGQRTPSPFCPDRANDQANLSSFQENPSSVSEDESTSDVNAQIAPDHSGAIDLGTLSGYTGPLSSAMMSPHDRQEHPLETQKDMGEGEHVAQAPAIVFIQGGGTSKRLPRPTSQELALHDNIIVKEGTPLYPIGVNDPNAASERSRDVQDESIYAELSGNHQSGKYGEQGPDMPHQDLNRSVLLDDGASTATLEKLQGQNSWAETSDTIPRKDKSLIHDAASIPRSDPLSLSPASNRELRAQEDVRSTPTKTSSHASGTEHGIPSLTPLRELMETAHDTSDDSSSFGPSHDVSKPENITPGENFGSNDLPNPDLFSSSTFLPLQRPSGGNKRFDLRKELPPVNTTGVERAAVQRINPSPALIKEASAHLTRTSVSSNRDVRPHTAASGTSQISQKIKGLIARESVDGGNTQPRLRRNSSEGSTSTTSDRFSGKAPKTLNKQQSFEQLIKSDETIQYTLTPKNMRDMEVLIYRPIRLGATLTHIVDRIVHAKYPPAA